jgi:methionine-S-sulfoxide reductase
MSQSENRTDHPQQTEVATFAGGCFWCMQPPFDNTPGVVSTRVGYTGGEREKPTYEQVCTGKTGHAEAVEVHFDPAVVDYEALLEVFWRNIDPTARNRQFADRGSQYRTAVFYHDERQRRLAEESKRRLAESGKFEDPIATEIAPAGPFFPAEGYHQDYYRKKPERYNAYKVGSGRAGFIARTWAGEPKR